jgi:uncharacterized protein (TIGR02996 family)
MDEEQAFLRAILSRPDDRAARLAFADWLDERGDPRGEVIRLAAAGRRAGRDGKARLAELREAVAPGWWPLLTGTVCERTEWVLHVGGDAGPAGTTADLGRRLDEVAGLDAVALALACEEPGGGDTCVLEVFAGDDRGCAQFTGFDGETHVRSRPLGEGGPAGGTRTFPAVPSVNGREQVKVHPSWTVPRADAVLALQYHFAYFGPWRRGGGSEFAPWVAWVPCAHCPLDRETGRPGRNPFTQ